MDDDIGEARERLSIRDKVFAAVVALILVAIIAAIFRLGIALLHG